MTRWREVRASLPQHLKILTKLGNAWMRIGWRTIQDITAIISVLHRTVQANLTSDLNPRILTPNRRHTTSNYVTIFVGKSWMTELKRLRVMMRLRSVGSDMEIKQNLCSGRVQHFIFWHRWSRSRSSHNQEHAFLPSVYTSIVSELFLVLMVSSLIVITRIVIICSVFSCMSSLSDPVIEIC